VDVTGKIGDAKDSDIVVVSVPISETGKILETLDGICKKDALIFDIASVKSPFIPILRRMAACRKVCSVHPMFGPSAVSMLGRNVIVCDCGNAEAVAEADLLFSNDDVAPVITSVERHDELAAFAMSLVHAAHITFVNALRNSGIPFSDLSGASSTTFTDTMKVSASVINENSSLYHEIQNMNANAADMWDVYERSLKEVRDASLSGDKKAFAGIMENGKRFLKGDHR